MSKYISALLAALVLFPALAFAQVPPPVEITPTTLPGSAFGTSVSHQIDATGGIAPYTFSATGLPAGVSINPSTGVISGSAIIANGVAPTQTSTGVWTIPPATYSVTVQVQDAVGQTASVTLPWDLTSSLTLTRSPATSVLTSPVSFHVQGIFGVDFCSSPPGTLLIRIPDSGGHRFNVNFPSASVGNAVDETTSISLPIGP